VLVAACLTPAQAEAAAAGAAAPPPAGHVWRPAVQHAIAYALKRRGIKAFAVATRHRYWGWHDQQTFPSASVLKAMLLVAYLDRGSVRHRRLGRSDRALLDPMIRRSNNAAASTVMGIVGTGGLRALANRSGMRRFTPVAGIWGNSRVDARDQARFFLRIQQFLPNRHRAYAMHLLASVVPSQRWGFGQVKPRHWQLYFKGGWGSGTGRVDHQVALLQRGARRVGVAIMTSNDGSHAYGKATLRGIAALLLRGLSQATLVP
jgi:beta-lactamase class A